MTEQPPAALLASETFVLVVEPQQPPAVLMACGDQGPAGRPGLPGAAHSAEVAGSALSALTVVYLLDGAVSPLGALDGAHIDLLLGLTLTAAAPGAPVSVQAAGKVSDARWAWLPGPVYLGSDGALTQVVPVSGWLVQVGSATSGSTIILNFSEPLEL